MFITWKPNISSQLQDASIQHFSLLIHICSRHVYFKCKWRQKASAAGLCHLSPISIALLTIKLIGDGPGRFVHSRSELLQSQPFPHCQFAYFSRTLLIYGTLLPERSEYVTILEIRKLLICWHSIRTSSPFWRTRPSNPRRASSPKKPTRDPNIVVGASYSHADMLKFDSLYVAQPRNWCPC